MKSRLTKKLIVVILIVFIGLLSFNTVWSIRSQYQILLDNLYEKAQLISTQMAASWQFMNINQDLINTTRENEYEYKGLHCAIVTKSVGKIFSSRNNAVKTHLTALEPRNEGDSPDAFEVEALKGFLADPEMQEYYEVVESAAGVKVYRYLSRLTITESCLECHGEPVGVIDKTGYPREGLKVGDLAGAISMEISMEEDLAVYNQHVVQDVLFIGVFASILCVLVFFWMRQNVSQPLKLLGDGVWRMRQNDLSAEVDEAALNDEFRELGHNFNRMARELEQMYSGLEAQVAARTEELSRLNEQLQQDNELKTDFMSMMSHELKTPLTAILAFTSLLKRDCASEIERTRLDEIEINSRRLLAMVNDILGMTRLEAGNVQIQEDYIDMVDVMTQVKSVIAPLADNKKITFVTYAQRGIPLVYVDADKLCHVLENICSNAVKFTNEGGHISMGAVRGPGKNEVSIHVTDDGIGIAVEKIPILFDKFVQLDSSASRRYNGSGLGLALAKEMVEVLHGKIDVESELGVGSKFTVTIPIQWGRYDEDIDS